MKFNSILVTGAAGFIGSHFVDYLLKAYRQIKVIGLDKLTYAADIKNLDKAKDYSNFTFIHGDINDALLVDKLMQTHDIDCITHFAAESHVDNSISEPEVFLKTNIIGTYTLLEAAKKHWQGKTDCLFHHVSTDEVYGDLTIDERAFTEKNAYKPSSPYSASKASSDHLVNAYHKTYSLPTTISNCSNNYGPRQNQEKLIPTIINACLNNQPIPIYGNGTNIRDWLYVKDHCYGIDLILQKGRIGETYNIGGGVELTNLDITKKICQIMDKLKPQSEPYQHNIKFIKDRLGHDFRYAINCEKISRDLGYYPQNDFITNLEQTVYFAVNAD